MKIKNFLALGLIAVVSGVATAQTYNATAGTNGTTDIQADYAQATGDGASVSVDVPLEFELPKKITFAIVGDDGSFPSSLPEFSDTGSLNHPVESSTSSFVFNGNLNNHPSLVPHGASAQSFKVSYLLHANTDVIVETNGSALTFTHESDPNSEIGTSWFNAGFHTVNGSATHKLFSSHATPGTLGSTETISIPASDFALYGGVLTGRSMYFLDTRTIDSTDRAGRYTSMVTIGVTTL